MKMMSDITQEHFTKVYEDEDSIMRRWREGLILLQCHHFLIDMCMNIEQTGSHLIGKNCIGQSPYLPSSLSNVSITIGLSAIWIYHHHHCHQRHCHRHRHPHHHHHHNCVALPNLTHLWPFACTTGRFWFVLKWEKLQKVSSSSRSSSSLPPQHCMSSTNQSSPIRGFHFNQSEGPLFIQFNVKFVSQQQDNLIYLSNI